ncbi:MAG: carboxypeptidase regulatory-like domain-containing protein [Deltaproteobacteria bacterium]|nr:MAG: carboxypeptidase regulatory-like domain-containing protein [Deltaproteobacteria bacterium]
MTASTLATLVECFAIAAIALPAAAQTTGAIQGAVVDAVSETAVPNAVIIARSPALQGEQTAVTDDSGRFQISLLPVGRYTLYVQRDGYQPFTQEGMLVVRLDQTVEVKLSLIPEALSAGEMESRRPSQ